VQVLCQVRGKLEPKPLDKWLFFNQLEIGMSRDSLRNQAKSQRASTKWQEIILSPRKRRSRLAGILYATEKQEVMVYRGTNLIQRGNESDTRMIAALKSLECGAVFYGIVYKQLGAESQKDGFVLT